MFEKFILTLSIFILMNHVAHAEEIDCERPQTTSDMGTCAKQEYEKSLAEFNALSKAFSSSLMLSEKSKRRLHLYFEDTAKMAKEICLDTYTDGSAKYLYAFSCAKEQIDMLIKSKKLYICMQEDEHECRNGGIYDPSVQ